MSNYNLRIDDLIGNSKFENLKLLVSLINSFVRIRNSIDLTIDITNKTISYEPFSPANINVIKFQYLDIPIEVFEFEKNDNSLRKYELIIDISSNIQKRVSKIFSKFDDKEFLLEVLITLEKELLK